MKSNAVKMCCKRGFTLIELLVVVLIIGILAAVALPQYNKAVKKSQVMESIQILSTLEKAVDRAILSGELNGEGFGIGRAGIPPYLDIDYSFDNGSALGEFNCNTNNVCINWSKNTSGIQMILIHVDTTHENVYYDLITRKGYSDTAWTHSISTDNWGLDKMGLGQFGFN